MHHQFLVASPVFAAGPKFGVLVAPTALDRRQSF